MSEQVISYAVEWQTVHKPGVWELYSTYYTDPQKAVSSFEAIKGLRGVIDVRIVERTVTRREIAFDELKRRKQVNMPWEMEIPMPREGYGYSRFIGKDTK